MNCQNSYSKKQTDTMYNALQSQFNAAIEDTYTQADIDLMLSGYSLITHDHDADYSALGHNHDTRYYTETEIDQLLTSIIPNGALVWWWTNVAPSGWAIANGNPLTTNCAYRYNLIGLGYPFGQSGSDPLLPNPGDRVILSAGTRSVGQTGGSETHTLTIAEQADDDLYWIGDQYGGGSGGYFGQVNTSSGTKVHPNYGQPHNNMQPYFVLTPIVYLGEIY